MSVSKEILKFKILSKNAIYAFLKEKYQDNTIKDEDDTNNLNKIIDILSNIEEFAHVPDKELIIKQEYQKIKNLLNNNEFREAKLLEYVQENSKELNQNEKLDIVYSIIHIMHLDNKISQKEKNIILQITKFLDIKDITYEEIIKSYYHKFKNKKASTLKILLIGIMLLVLASGGAYWLYLQNLNKQNSIKIFQQEEIAFSEVYFNRFVIYQNKFFNSNSKYFKKQAIYYINGKAEISFEPKRLNYDPLKQVLTYTYPKGFFNITLNTNKTLEVDKIDPKPISAQEAEKIAIGVGLAGAYFGGKAGYNNADKLTKILPESISKYIKIGSTALGGAIAGATSYFITFNALKDLQLSSKITEKEKVAVINNAKKLIKAQIILDERLQKKYKDMFKSYLKYQYSKANININKIIFKAE
jgi:hypothetical protein